MGTIEKCFVCFAMLLLLTGGRAASFAVPLQATNMQANQIVKEGQ